MNTVCHRLSVNYRHQDSVSYFFCFKETLPTLWLQIKVRSLASGASRRCNADDCIQRGQRKCSTSYPPQRPTQAKCSNSHGSFNTLFDSKLTEFRRHSNAGDMTWTASVHSRQRLTASNNIDKSHQVFTKQRRFSLQDSSSSGRSETNAIHPKVVAVAKTGNRVLRNAPAARRLSDSKLLSTESELFRERSLSDCNRVARMRVMARLVLRSPAPSSGSVAHAWGGMSIPPRRLEPLTARSITSATDIVAESTSAELSKDASVFDDDLTNFSTKREKDHRETESPPSMEIRQLCTELVSPLRHHERTGTTATASSSSSSS